MPGEERSRRRGPDSRPRVWATYTLTALLWPFWIEIFVFAGAAAQRILATFLAPGAALAIAVLLAIAACGAASWWLGAVLRRFGAARLWIVGAAWFAVAAAIAVAALGLSDVPSVLGPLGVLGPFAAGAVGLFLGVRRPRDRGSR